jgi:copper chaperone CopZ
LVFFLAFPYLGGSLNTSSRNNQMKGEISEIIIPVEGMTCSGCEFNIENTVKKLDGIIKVKAGYKKYEVIVKSEKGKVNINDMMEAINKSGYEVIKQ